MECLPRGGTDGDQVAMTQAPLQILFAKVMHKRLFPRVNAFQYGIFYFSVPLSRWGEKRNSRLFDFERPALFSLYAKDYGARDGSNPEKWAREILRDYGVTQADGEIFLITMPRMLGYAFNPVSFWLCTDRNGDLRAVLCEVNNTFGERHCYLCAHADGRAILPQDILTGEKLFHVSPFLERNGHYRYRFQVKPESFGAWIDYYDAKGDKQLVTALTGQKQILTPKTCRTAFFKYPLVTLKAIALIHYQACKLLLKKIRYIPKPPQKPQQISATSGRTSQKETEKC